MTSNAQIRKWIVTSPPVAWAIRQLRELLIGALKQGPIPQHVAFVMDGNRRFARNHHIETVEGHNLGFESLARILEVCYKTGVKVVTIYAFSIENFKRSQHEVDALMNMAKTKLQQLADHGALLDRYGASIRILGQRELIQPDVLRAVDKAVAMTAHNKKAVLNVCFPYTSRHEIQSAVVKTVETYGTPIDNASASSKRAISKSHISQHIRKQMREDDKNEQVDRSEYGDDSFPSRGASAAEDEHSSSASTAINAPDKDETPGRTFLDPESISIQTLDANMMTADAPPLDLLIRTSGVERLSDFMLWQSHQATSIVFLQCLWPEFDLWHFLPVLVEWQWQQKKCREEQQRNRVRPKVE